MLHTAATQIVKLNLFTQQATKMQVLFALCFQWPESFPGVKIGFTFTSWSLFGCWPISWHNQSERSSYFILASRKLTRSNLTGSYAIFSFFLFILWVMDLLLQERHFSMPWIALVFQLLMHNRETYPWHS